MRSHQLQRARTPGLDLREPAHDGVLARGEERVLAQVERGRLEGALERAGHAGQEDDVPEEEREERGEEGAAGGGDAAG